MSRNDKPPQWRTRFNRFALILAPLLLVLGTASGFLSGSGEGNPWFAALVKPALYPPPIAFPIVWSVLYLLMGVALAAILAGPPSPARRTAIIAFVMQFILNLIWSPMFFAVHSIGGALIVILALFVALGFTIVAFARVNRMAAYLLVPYIVWVSFAAGLNLQLLKDNPWEGDARASGTVAPARA